MRFKSSESEARDQRLRFSNRQVVVISRRRNNLNVALSGSFRWGMNRYG